MKRLLVLFSVGVLALGMAGCGDNNAEGSSQPSVSSMPSIVLPDQMAAPDPTITPDSAQAPNAGTGTSSAGGGHDYSQGWTEEMEAIKTVVTDMLGDNYFPNMPLDPELLEQLIGIAPDMYEDYFAEIPMISANVDSLIVVKAAEGQADNVEKALNDYRDRQVNNTMQYPQNVGKVHASKVEKSGNCVIFTMLGGDIGDLLDQGDEAVITYCQEVNDSVIEAILDAVK